MQLSFLLAFSVILKCDSILKKSEWKLSNTGHTDISRIRGGGFWSKKDDVSVLTLEPGPHDVEEEPLLDTSPVTKALKKHKTQLQRAKMRMAMTSFSGFLIMFEYTHEFIEDLGDLSGLSPLRNSPIGKIIGPIIAKFANMKVGLVMLTASHMLMTVAELIEKVNDADEFKEQAEKEEKIAKAISLVHSTEENAARAYDKIAVSLFPLRAVLNFPSSSKHPEQNIHTMRKAKKSRYRGVKWDGVLGGWTIDPMYLDLTL